MASSTDDANSNQPTAAECRLASSLTPESSIESESLLNPKGTIRRKLSKQKGVEETETALPKVQEQLDLDPGSLDKEDSPSAINSRSRQLVRGLALCGDDDTRLRPPPAAMQKHPNSLSRESSGTDYTDSSGIDLRAFVVATLHKNPRDRQMALWLEQQLTTFVNDEKAQSFKFPQMSSYNRMLIHRIAALFGLDHNVDNSGKCVVVNKTDRTARPDFDFSNLIVGSQYSDNRRNYRSVHSFDEMARDHCLMNYPYHQDRSVDSHWNRRTQSFESQQMATVPQTASPYYQHHHSFEVPNYAQSHAERTAMLRKAGSFGGVPVYYRSGSALDNTVERPMNTPSQRDYSSHGSMGSPANLTELTDGMAAIQIEPHRTPIQMSPIPPREYVYGYPQPIYAHSPSLSPGYQHPYVVTGVTTTVQHSIAIPASPQVPYIHSPHYFTPQNGYVEQECLYSVPSNYGLYAQASPVPMSYVIPQTTYYEEDSQETSSPQQGVEEVSQMSSSTVPHPISLDGGYGSLTHQDSLREEAEYTAE